MEQTSEAKLGLAAAGCWERLGVRRAAPDGAGAGRVVATGSGRLRAEGAPGGAHAPEGAGGQTSEVGLGAAAAAAVCWERLSVRRAAPDGAVAGQVVATAAGGFGLTVLQAEHGYVNELRDRRPR